MFHSDNGPEFISSAAKEWLRKFVAETLYIAPGILWKDGYIESFNSGFRDELLNREVFLRIDELRLCCRSLADGLQSLRCA